MNSRTVCDVFVPGIPVPQGSLRAGNRGQLFYSNAATLKPWRDKISKTIKEALYAGHEAIDAPIEVLVTFVFPPLKTPKEWKLSAPDLDKLERAVLDAITNSGLYVDDSRVVHVDAWKFYGEESGCHIKVNVLE